MLHMRGVPQTIISNATANQSVTYTVGSYNAVLVVHSMSGETKNGFVSLNLIHGSDKVPHHGKGTNIPLSGQSSDYSCIFEGLTDRIEITLTCSSGTHTVTVIPLVVW